MASLTHRDKCASTKDCRFWWCVEKEHCFGSPRIEIPISKAEKKKKRKLNKTGKPKLVASRKSKIMSKTGGLCWLCLGELKDEDYTVDHKRPISRGGTNRLDNLFPAHRRCNQLKGNILIKSSEEFNRLFPNLNQLVLNLAKVTPK